MKAFLNILVTGLLLFFAASCKNTNEAGEVVIKGSPLTGREEVWGDESLNKIIEQQREVFEAAYPHAFIVMHYASEMEIKRKFFADSIDVMIISHGLDSIELSQLQKKEVWPRQYLFGKSSIAFIASKNHQQSKYKYEDIIKMLSTPERDFAIENKNSGIALELLKHLKGKSLSERIYALANRTALIQWVNESPDRIGVMDWSNVSDEDDPDAREILSEVKVLSISGSTPETAELYYDPSQANMNGLYPFTRDLYFIRRLGITDVTLGFASFICGERGQKIMLKAGLLPEYQSERWVEFKGLTEIKVVE